MQTIAVLGPGGVGGFLAAALWRAQQRVIVIGREATVEQLRGRGIAVQSEILGNFAARPEAQPALTAAVDVLFVTTKAAGLEPALDRIRATPQLVVPLLNGLEHMPVLRQRFGPRRVPAATIRIESHSPQPGQVLQSSPSVRVDLATDDPALAPALRPVADLLARAGIPVQVLDSEADVLWSKLVRLVALACTTSASDQPIGFIRSDPAWRATLQAAIAEAAAVANADGADVQAAATRAELESAHAGLGSSMQRDIAAGREPELDAIAGAVLRAGRRHGLQCPTIAQLSRTIAARAGLQPPPF